MKSELGKLGKADFWKGLVVAILFALLTGIITVCQSMDNLENINYLPIVSSTVVAFCSYILKNLFENSEGKFMQPEKGA